MSWMSFPLPSAELEPAAGAAIPAPETNFDAPGFLAEFRRVEEYWDKDRDRFALRDGAGPRLGGSKMGAFEVYSFIVVRTSGKDESDTPETTVEINSQPLKYICQHVIGNDDGVSWTSSRLRVKPRVFFEYHSKLSDHLQSLKSETPEAPGIPHLELLLHFASIEYADDFRQFEELIARREITFDMLKCILLPGTILYTVCPLTGEPLACRIVDISLRRNSELSERNNDTGLVYREATGRRNIPSASWQIHGAYVAARVNSGRRFENAKRTVFIDIFHGVSAIHMLPAYPLNMHADEPKVRRLLIDRGRKWEALDGVFHKDYDGVAYNAHSDATTVIVNSRIIVDRKLYEGMATENGPRYPPRPPHPSEGNEIEGSGTWLDDCTLVSDSLSDEEAALTPALVRGFSLGDKLWLLFKVNEITEINWTDGAFERLLIPDTQKKLIQGLVESQTTKRNNCDDFVEGKGRGIVVSLVGPPGVGKTLTAEAASEHLRMPMYVVGARDLGTFPPDVERGLGRIFKLSAAWGAVVLLDDADVYMTKRDTNNLYQDVLFVFLRQIEHFSGILFLTTNRLRVYDEAFQSRIHLSLKYCELDAPSRRLLWRRFIDQVGGQLSPLEEATLVALPLNGRQIKNVINTGDAIASSFNEQVSYGHIKGVVDAMQDFEQDVREPKMPQSKPAQWVRSGYRALKLLLPTVGA